MTDERWETLRKVTWFRQEQDEVSKYVEALRLELQTLRDDRARAFRLAYELTPETQSCEEMASALVVLVTTGRRKIGLLGELVREASRKTTQLGWNVMATAWRERADNVLGTIAPLEGAPSLETFFREYTHTFDPVCWATLYNDPDPLSERCWRKPGHTGMHRDQHQGWTDTHPEHRPGPPDGHVYTNKLGASE